MFNFNNLLGWRGLTYDDVEEIDDMLVCKDADDLEEFHQDLFNRLEQMMEHDHIEDHPDYNKIDEAIKHYQRYTDRRTAKEHLEDHIEEVCIAAGFNGDGRNIEAERQRYFPDRYNKELPRKGGWVMIIIAPAVELSARPLAYSVYFAKPAPVYKEVTLGNTYWSGKKIHRLPYYKVKIMTEGGEVHLWPHEYVQIRDTEALMEEVGNSFDLVRLGGDTNYDAAKVHYLGTRGLNQSDVYRLLLGTLNTTGHAYFRIREEATPFWEFYTDCLQRGIRPELAVVLWEHKESGKPLFNVTVTDEHGNPIDKSKRRKKADTKTITSTGKKGNSDSDSGKKR